jgi:hypothetical protein
MEVCCCSAIHGHATTTTRTTKKPLSMARLTQVSAAEEGVDDDNNCCAGGICKNDKTMYQKEKTTTPPESSFSFAASLTRFFRNVKGLYAAALGIEILCIASAEIGENSSLYLFGFNAVGIPIAYAMGYVIAGFSTFAAILGRYNYRSMDKIDSCCSVLEQGAGAGFIPNLKITFRNFALGIVKISKLHKQPNLKYILKTSGYILVTAESACILTAETVDLIFYQYSLLLSVPLALLAGAFAVVVPEAYR